MITVRNTTEGLIPSLEIKGNTVQNQSNLSDIKSVGIDKGDGTYEVSILSCDENLFDGVYFENKALYTSGINLGQEYNSGGFYSSANFIKVKPNTKYKLKDGNQCWVVEYDSNKKGIYGKDYYGTITTRENTKYIKFYTVTARKDDFMLVEGENFKPYKIQNKDKCIIKLPCQLEKVGDIADRLYFDKIENAWCIEKKAIPKVEDGIIVNKQVSPQKIVLPLDTQIQLNQFADTTHVWLECGEVDGTIKATFSKSMASTVQTNSNKINILSDRVASIEGLKESQDMVYSSDNITNYNGNIVCKETKNGTVKDLRISGKSLNNIYPNKYKWQISTNEIASNNAVPFSSISMLEPNTEYTAILFGAPSYLNGFVFHRIQKDASRIRGCIGKFVTNDLSDLTSSFHVYASSGSVFTAEDLNKIKVVLIKGDHTQNPPNSYFEGIASVGNGVDEIEVSSVNKCIDLELGGISTSNGELTVGNLRMRSVKFLDYYQMTDILMLDKNKYEILFHAYDENKNYIKPSNGGSYSKENVKFDVNVKYFKFVIKKINGNAFDLNDAVCLIKDSERDKKPILFKDTDGTLKPVKELRGLDTVCDTIELHNDGKYYYHQRTGNDVLNGIEDWITGTGGVENANNIYFATNKFDNIANKMHMGLLSRFANKTVMSNDVEGVQFLNQAYYLRVRINKTKLETQDIEGIKKYFQTNNEPIIYPLAEEKVFEVNPLFLEAYANETMISCSSGAINPGLELKISSYLPNIVKLNEKRISKLETDFYQYTVVQNRLALTSRYNADRVDFKVDNTIGNPLRSSKALDHDLFNLMKVNIEVGKENYNRVEMEEKMDFYVNEGIIDWDMWDELFEAMELQHNPPVDLTPIEPMTVEVKEDETPKKPRRGRKKKVVEEI